MSSKDKAAVKACLTAYLADRKDVTIRELGRQVKETTGLDFSQPILAKYIIGMGWQRQGYADGTTTYVRETSS